MNLPFIVFLLATVASTAPVDHPDRVTRFPGAPSEPSFPLYSGYLDVEENSTQHKIFYVLCEAIRTKPSESPLIVWLNGGPGASSLFGLLLEHGPFLLDAETGQLRYNDFSWNQYANVLYIETPTGVGFSHSNQSDFASYDDNSTAILNRKALHDFMTRVHPRYATRDFYLTGESYAGVYIPYLAREIPNAVNTGEFTNFNLKGIAMGNAAVYDYRNNTLPAALQLYSLGMLPEQNVTQLFGDWERVLTGEHVYYEEQMMEKLGSSAIYNLPLECNRMEDDKLWHIAKPARNVECEWHELIESYLNREDVQKSLHARTGDQPIKWTLISHKVIQQYERDEDSTHLYKDIIALAKDGFRILFYTGDQDLMCPPLQVAYGAGRIAKLNDMTQQLRYVASSWSYLGDFGGARTSYTTKNNTISMDVITVRGAGHMMPANQPDRAFQIINNFITAHPSEPVDYSKMIPRR